MNDISDMSKAFMPKSNQLNNDQLIGGPVTIKITGVSTEFTDNKTKAVINYENDGGRPYKPSLGMGRILLEAWGSDGNEWIGQSLILYRDPTVMFGKEQAGGIRISHMSGVKGNFTAYVTEKRGRKTPYSVKLLVVDAPAPANTLDELIAKLSRATSSKDVKAVNALAKNLEEPDRSEYMEALATLREVKRQQAEAKKEALPVVEEVPAENNDEFLASLNADDEFPM